jgi:hypothetical protein
MAASAFAQLASRFNGLPRNQQQAILYGVPVAILLGFGYLTWGVMGQLGSDPGIPSLLRRENMGIWANISDIESQITVKQGVIDRKPDIVKRLGAIQDDITAAEQRLPREAEKAQMREVIERLAREIPPEIGAVKLKSVRIVEDESSSSRKGGLRTVVYQTEVTGDLNGLIKYIDSIEKNTRFMSVNTISFRGGSLRPDPDKKGKLLFEPHSVKMDLVTYVYAAGKSKVAQ